MKHIKRFLKSSFFRFLLLGVWSYLSKVALSALFFDALRFNPFVGYALVLLLVVVINYTLNFYVVFRNTSGHKKKFVQYLATTFGMMLIDYALVNILLYLGIHYAIAIFIVSIIIMLIKFIIFHKVVFRE